MPQNIGGCSCSHKARLGQATSLPRLGGERPVDPQLPESHAQRWYEVLADTVAFASASLWSAPGGPHRALDR